MPPGTIAVAGQAVAEARAGGKSARGEAAGAMSKSRRQWRRLNVALVGAVLVVAPVVSARAQTLPADRALADQKLELEVRKLALEVERLSGEHGAARKSWIESVPGPVIALAGVMLSVAAAWATARLGRWGTFDLAVVQKRLGCYPAIVAAMRPMALYFPPGELTPAACRTVGEELRNSYLGDAGLLFSEEAKQRYFLLARALTRAAAAAQLTTPEGRGDEQWVSAEHVDDYRAILGITEPDLKCVEAWGFGSRGQRSAGNAEAQTGSERTFDAAQRERAGRFADFVLLQTLASRMRSALAQDIRGRRRPA